MRVLCNVETVAMQGKPPDEEHLCDLSGVHVLEACPFVFAAAQWFQGASLDGRKIAYKMLSTTVLDKAGLALSPN